MLLQLLTLQSELNNGLVSTPKFFSEHVHLLQQLLKLQTRTHTRMHLYSTSTGGEIKIKSCFSYLGYSIGIASNLARSICRRVRILELQNTHVHSEMQKVHGETDQ